jgi:microcystin-dependent protein
MTSSNVSASTVRVNVASSTYPLHVMGAGAQLGTLLLSTTNSASASVRAEIALHDFNRTMTLINNGISAVTINSFGQVGINSTSPSSALTVGGSASISGTLTLAGATVHLTGLIQMYGGSTAPTGWLLCDGSLVSKTAYAALYALLGSTFGAETTTQFYLPDMRGRSPLGSGTGSGLTARSVGGSGGAETYTLTISDMPSHNHGGASGGMSANQTHTHPIPYNNSSAGQSQYAYESNSGAIIDGRYNTESSANLDHTHSITSQGGGGAHTIMSPWLCVAFIIKT